MTVFGVDHTTRPSIAALKRARVRFVCRYLSRNRGKNLSPGEARELTAAGIWIVVVWETTAQRALSGHAGGVADARAALAQAQACGMPHGRPIFFAVDFDAQPKHLPAVLGYLDGAASVLGKHATGVYGGYRAVHAALSGHCAWGWQTYAWSHGVWDSRAQLQQYSNDRRVGGVGVDYNRAVHADYGQWRVGITPEGDDVASDDTIKKIAAATAAAVLDRVYNARGHRVKDALQGAKDGVEKLLAQHAQHAATLRAEDTADTADTDAGDIDAAVVDEMDEVAMARGLLPGLAAALSPERLAELMVEACPAYYAHEFHDAMTSELGTGPAAPGDPPRVPAADDQDAPTEAPTDAPTEAPPEAPTS
jgi:hypothetical protein